MLATIGVTSLFVIIVVEIHFEALSLLLRWLPRVKGKIRTRAAIGVLGALAAHTVEAVVFSFGYYILHFMDDTGELLGKNFTGTFDDCLYYSFVTYTSLGFGDITPTGALRFFTAMETLTGLVLIAWTASFMFVMMERFWLEECDVKEVDVITKT